MTILKRQQHIEDIKSYFKIEEYDEEYSTSVYFKLRLGNKNYFKSFITGGFSMYYCLDDISHGCCWLQCDIQEQLFLWKNKTLK